MIIDKTLRLAPGGGPGRGRGRPRPRGTKIRREVVLIRVLNSLGGNKDY